MRNYYVDDVPLLLYWGGDFTGNINRAQPFRITRDVRFGLEGSPSEEQQCAVFLSDTVYLGVGARYTRYHLLDLDNDPATDSSYRASALTPTFALIYKPFSYVSLYGSYRVDVAFTFGLGAVYLDPSIRNVSAGNEALRGNVRYFGKAPTSDANTLFIPSRTLTNMGFQYQAMISGQRVDFTGNVNNLSNVKYWGQSNIGEGINGALSAKIYW